MEKLSKSESNYQTIKRQVEKPVADEITQWITEYNADENNKKNPIRGIRAVSRRSSGIIPMVIWRPPSLALPMRTVTAPLGW